jgi:hypothetical protein
MSTDSPPRTAPRHRQSKARNALRQMIWLGGLALVAIAILNHVFADTDHGPLWRVLVAILAFLYLWWLAALLFDLVFVWHRYIHHDVALKFLRDRVKPKDLAARAPRAANNG